jgi:membrane protein
MDVHASVTVVLLFILAVLGFVFLFFFVGDLRKNRENMEKETSFFLGSLISFVINFFDVFGIGNFAPGASLYKGLKQTDDRLIPGTLNVACTIPVIAEAFLFIHGVKVEPLTLVSMIVSAMVGAWVGAGFISKLSKEKIQLVMGVAMTLIAFVIIAQVTKLVPVDGTAIGLHGIKLVIAVIGNFFLGAVMTAGVGLYAPCLALVCLLGINVSVAFPIMMGACAYLMPVASIRFIKQNSYNRKLALGGNIFGTIAVILAFRVYLLISGSLPSHALKIIVICVMFYTAISMFYSLYKEEKGRSKHRDIE